MSAHAVVREAFAWLSEDESRTVTIHTIDGKHLTGVRFTTTSVENVVVAEYQSMTAYPIRLVSTHAIVSINLNTPAPEGDSQ